MNKVISLAAVVAVALAGCSSAGGPQARYGSVTELRDAAVAAGYPCPSWVQTNRVEAAAESGTCSDTDVFSTYATPGQLEVAVTRMKTMNKLSATVVLVGENWMIRSDSAGDIQPKMGGTILR